MGYLKIPNLYKDQTLLADDEVVVMEKIHGTSAHLHFTRGEDGSVSVRYFSGGVKHEDFVALFADREEAMLDGARALMFTSNMTVYGEACGGKCQKMSHAYGPNLRFVAFDVLADGQWQAPVFAHGFAMGTSLEFVPWWQMKPTMANLDGARDMPSQFAMRSGYGVHNAEGIVIRPLYERVNHRGERVIAKHKRAEFCETKSKRETSVDPEKHRRMLEAEAIATEWVTEMRIAHVADRAIPGQDPLPEHLGKLIPAMQEDVRVEAGDEIVWNKDVERAVGTHTAVMVKAIARKRLEAQAQ